MRKLLFFSIIAGSLVMTQSIYTFPSSAATRNGDLINWIDSSGSSGSFSPSYGQLCLSSQNITFTTADAWRSIPFDSTGLSSNMDVSTGSPATITVQQAGVYQTNFSLYFSVEESDEGTFTATNYTLGISINGVTTPVSSVYAGERGRYSLNYSNLAEFSEDDYVRFYMEASDTEEPSFNNNISLEKGNVYLMQISN